MKFGSFWHHGVMKKHVFFVICVFFSPMACSIWEEKVGIEALPPPPLGDAIYACFFACFLENAHFLKIFCCRKSESAWPGGLKKFPCEGLVDEGRNAPPYNLRLIEDSKPPSNYPPLGGS